MKTATRATRRTRNLLGARRSGGDPSARMFARIGYRLTLLYVGVLAGILLLAGLLLYVAMQQVLLSPVGDTLTMTGQRLADGWRISGRPPRDCVAPEGPESAPYFLACYDASGGYTGGDRLAGAAPGFITPEIAKAALTSGTGSATDTVNGQNGLGSIRRLALVVRDPADGGVLGVVQIGLDIEGDIQALQVLLVLLLLVGTLTLLGSGLGGMFLSRRALAPARLALARQRAFIADASHELRTPITLLRADAEVLLRGGAHLAPEDAALLGDIVTEVAHMTSLADNLLLLARLDGGAAHLEHEVVDLAEVATHVAGRTRAYAAERQVALDARDVGRALVIGDRALLEHAALILVDNAIKYNHAGGTVTLRTAVAGERAVFEVRDTGVGIAAEHLPHLGERFYRVDKARSREAGGAGLGLSIARGIAAAHRGTLDLTSDPATGTTATLRLPAAAPGAASAT